MKIALASKPVIDGDIEYNENSILKTIKECCGKADVVLFGETVLQGFNSLVWDYAADSIVAVCSGDNVISQIRRAAKQSNVAVCFGYIERCGEELFSSQIFIGSSGEVINNFRRVSVGWKEYRLTDGHYREGDGFQAFSYGGKKFAVGLCGDLWTEGRPEEMYALEADIVLWPVWCDYAAAEWNGAKKYEYAEQAARCGRRVLLVNPFCTDEGVSDGAQGGAAYFSDGKIVAEMPAGATGIFIVEV